ncbi:hypothetical protein C0216_33180 (plasmid) [Streptomyces globosus]|uniref:Twin-arginine translocation signal domain-containing protein n=1 Tax=Streptomyces globosus TaxID=68209 RepID=A0A344UBN1_9ACTN|nr:hypothetical protein [Streptomyces globosus]AXE28302.1 hypothetical protein C0216_33180 [Streptomyces globosus]
MDACLWLSQALPLQIHNAGMTTFLSRRRLLGAAAAAGGIGFLGTAASARAADLPAVGQTITLGMNAFGATLVVDLPPPLPTLNFIGARTLKVTSASPGRIEYATVSAVLEAAHPLFGKITARIPEEDAIGGGVVHVDSGGGAVDSWHQNWRLTFEKCGDMPGPFSFVSAAEGRWEGRMDSFPPPASGMNTDGSPTGGAPYTSLGTIDFRLPATEAPEGDAEGPLVQPLAGSTDIYCRLQDTSINQGTMA